MMNRILPAIAAAALLMLVSACGGSMPGTTPSGVSATGGTPGAYIVVLKAGHSVADVNALSAGLAARPVHSYQHALTGFAGQLNPAEHSRLLADQRVAYIEPDLPVEIVKGKPPGTPGDGGGGGGEDSPSQGTPWGISRIGANSNAGSGGAGVAVAVIDTGVDLDHPDLNSVISGINVFKTTDPADDDNGHGSHVAGTIAAADNGFGYVGVAPNSTIFAVKVLDRRGRGNISGVVAGIDWVAANAAANGITVANMSLGGSGFSQAMYDSIQQATDAGVTFVVAAGNDRDSASSYSPAQFDNTITVSGIDSTDGFYYYSNFGNAIDLTAPAVNVPSLYKNGGYKTLTGTSMASPHVAGAVALWLDDHSGGFDAVKTALLAAAESAPSGGWPGDNDGIDEPLVNAAGL